MNCNMDIYVGRLKKLVESYTTTCNLPKRKSHRLLFHTLYHNYHLADNNNYNFKIKKTKKLLLFTTLEKKEKYKNKKG